MYVEMRKPFLVEDANILFKELQMLSSFSFLETSSLLINQAETSFSR